MSTIYETAAPSDDERAWLVEYVEDCEAVLSAGSEAERYSRLEQFSFGFAQIRSLDGPAAQGTVLNWCEAVADYGLAVIDRACLMWNGRKFAWQKVGLVPNPDEIARACREADAVMRAETRELQRVLAAEVVALPPPPLTDAQRAENLKALAELRMELVAMSAVTDARREPKPAPDRYPSGYLDELRAREARRLAQDSQIPSGQNRSEISEREDMV